MYFIKKKNLLHQLKKWRDDSEIPQTLFLCFIFVLKIWCLNMRDCPFTYTKTPSSVSITVYSNSCSFMTQENSNPESSDLQIFLTHYNYNYAQFTSHLNQNWENIVIVLKSNTFSQYHHAIPHEHPSNSSSGREFASDAGDRCSIPGRKKKQKLIPKHSYHFYLLRVYVLSPTVVKKGFTKWYMYMSLYDGHGNVVSKEHLNWQFLMEPFILIIAVYSLFLKLSRNENGIHQLWNHITTFRLRDYI